MVVYQFFAGLIVWAGLKGRLPSANGHPPSLEDVFLQLTGKKLAGEDEAHG